MHYYDEVSITSIHSKAIYYWIYIWDRQFFFFLSFFFSFSSFSQYHTDTCTHRMMLFASSCSGILYSTLDCLLPYCTVYILFIYLYTYFIYIFCIMEYILYIYLYNTIYMVKLYYIYNAYTYCIYTISALYFHYNCHITVTYYSTYHQYTIVHNSIL